MKTSDKKEYECRIEDLSGFIKTLSTLKKQNLLSADSKYYDVIAEGSKIPVSKPIPFDSGLLGFLHRSFGLASFGIVIILLVFSFVFKWSLWINLIILCLVLFSIVGIFIPLFQLKKK